MANTSFSISHAKRESTLVTNEFQGINLSVNSSQIKDNESPDMLNLLSNDKGALDGRRGWKTLFASLGSSAINALFEYKKESGNIYLFAYEDKLYKIDDIDSEPLTYSLVYTGLMDNLIRGFTYNDLFYILDGNEYYVYDGTSVSTVEGYIPILTISTLPTGGGTYHEALNLISPYFAQSFNGDNLTYAYTMLYSRLDTSTVLVSVDDVDLVEDVDFSVDRVVGKVTFNIAPATGVNNVVIKASKAVVGNRDKICKCSIFALWGSGEGSRIFLSGNSSYKNYDFRSGLQDPTYFPDDGFDVVGSPTNAIMQYSYLYDALVILKEQSIYIRQMDINNGQPLYYKSKLNSAIGASGMDDVVILDNFPTFVSNKGIYQITSINTQNEENVRCISEKINKNILSNALSAKGILDLGGLDKYKGVDYEKKYYLFHPDLEFAWVYDYESTSLTYKSFFRLDNIKVNSLLVVDNNIYFGRSDKGCVSRMKSALYEDINYDEDEDVDIAINRYWISKYFNFGTSTSLKMVSKVFITLRPQTDTTVELYSRTNRRGLWKKIKELSASLFAYSLFSYSKLTYGSNPFPQQSRIKVKEKKIGYYQLKIGNNTIASSIGMLNLGIKFIIQREVR